MTRLEECRAAEASDPQLAAAERTQQSQMQLEARERINALRAARRKEPLLDDDDSDEDELGEDDFDVEVEYRP